MAPEEEIHYKLCIRFQSNLSHASDIHERLVLLLAHVESLLQVLQHAPLIGALAFAADHVQDAVRNLNIQLFQLNAISLIDWPFSTYLTVSIFFLFLP